MLKIFVAVPTTGSVVDSQSFALREMEELYKDVITLVYPKICVRRTFHDFARNQMVEEFLDSGADILWFLDSDITPSPYLLDIVKNHHEKWKVAGATYPVFMQPPGLDHLEVVFTAYKKNPKTGNFMAAPVPMTGRGFVDGLATGCLFIKREVIEKLSKPYFEFSYNSESREITEGEDLGFMRKLSALDIKVFTDFELACKHQKTVDLLDVSNYAMAYSNRQVEIYAQAARNEMGPIINAAYDKGYLAALDKIKEEHEKQVAEESKKIWTPKLITKV